MEMLEREYKQAIADYNRIENQFNNTLDDDLIDVLIHERNAVEKKIGYLKRKIKNGKDI